MTFPIDFSKPETRPEPITFYTDEATFGRLNDLVTEKGLDRSLIVHRIVRQALEPEKRSRRASDAA